MRRASLAAVLTIVLLTPSLASTMPATSAPQGEGSSPPELTSYGISFIEWIFAHPGETRVQREMNGVTYEAIFQADVHNRQAEVVETVVVREGEAVLEAVTQEFLVINQSTPESPDTYLVVIPSSQMVVKVTPDGITKLGPNPLPQPWEDVRFYVGGWGDVYAGEDSHPECWGQTFYVAGAAHLVDEGFLAIKWDGPGIYLAWCWLPMGWYGTTVEAWDDKDFSYSNPWADRSGSVTVSYDHTYTWLTVKVTWHYFVIVI